MNNWAGTRGGGREKRSRDEMRGGGKTLKAGRFSQCVHRSSPHKKPTWLKVMAATLASLNWDAGNNKSAAFLCKQTYLQAKEEAFLRDDSRQCCPLYCTELHRSPSFKGFFDAVLLNSPGKHTLAFWDLHSTAANIIKEADTGQLSNEFRLCGYFLKYSPDKKFMTSSKMLLCMVGS